MVHCFQKIWYTPKQAPKWPSAVRNEHWAATNHLSRRGLVQRQGGVPEGAVH